MGMFVTLVVPSESLVNALTVLFGNWTTEGRVAKALPREAPTTAVGEVATGPPVR